VPRLTSIVLNTLKGKETCHLKRAAGFAVFRHFLTHKHISGKFGFRGGGDFKYAQIGLDASVGSAVEFRA